MIRSISGQLKQGKLASQRPFRDPHHSSSIAAMVGGGRKALPGEISLAHNGVLFLDELPEFPRSVLEALRQPLEIGTVSIARAQAHVTYPARFQLIAAMNPCRCGYLGDAARACNKAPKCGADYQSKLSGPLLDRIDLHIDVAEVPPMAIFKSEKAESSASVAARVVAARDIQRKRAKTEGFSTTLNAHLPSEWLFSTITEDTACQQLLEKASSRFQLSMRSITRLLRVTRSIADLASDDQVNAAHLSEALSYRLQHAGFSAVA